MYIDPNTGGVLFQILAILFGVVSGAVLLFSSKIRILSARVKRSLRSKNEQVVAPGLENDSDQHDR